MTSKARKNTSMPAKIIADSWLFKGLDCFSKNTDFTSEKNKGSVRKFTIFLQCGMKYIDT